MARAMQSPLLMGATLRKHAVAAGLVATVVVACGGQTGIGSPLSAVIGNAACPELRGGAMNATFDEDARANATIRAFVTASGDLAEVAAKVRADVFTACERMADDLGIPQSERRGIRTSDDNAVTSACGAVAARIDAIMKEGASANLRADVTPPRCEVNAHTEAACKAQCNAQGSAQGAARGQAENGTATGAAAGSATAEAQCNASCKAHADLTAQCTEAQVRIEGNVNTGEMAKVAATFQRNLPPLIKAQIAYGERIADDVRVLVRTAADLPEAVGHLSARAGACVAAAANATVAAQASLRVSLQASASVTAKAGASS